MNVKTTFYVGVSLFLVACQTRSTSNAVFPNEIAPGAAPRSDQGTRKASSSLTEANEISTKDGGYAVENGTSTGEESNEEGPNDELDEADSIDSSGAMRRIDDARHPLDGLTEQDLERRLKSDPQSLGSVSIGRPNAGSLFNAVRMPEDEAWKLVDPHHAYGTEETIDALRLALRAVYDAFPGTPVISIGHLSAKQGGHLRPHRSHQSGRDVDISFYYDGAPNRWYAKASPSNLDLARTMFLIRTLVEKTNIEMILVDQSLHAPLKRYALDHGLGAEWVEGLFSRYEGRAPVVRHAPGHATHLHLRFRNPHAERSGQRLALLLGKHELVAVPPKTVTHVARTGDTLAKLAVRYGTTMRAIRVRNAMASVQLVAGRPYQIPVDSKNPPPKDGRNRKNASNDSSLRKNE